MITRDELGGLYDFENQNGLVIKSIGQATESPEALVRFLGRYTSWNGFFGSGVATLAGKIGRSRGFFRDGEEPITPLADRSVLVASFFFDAARDEFDDRDTTHRDSHRCLAQATVKGTVDFFKIGAKAMDLLADPLWLRALQDRVRVGYGDGTSDDLPAIFRAVGYHLGSELLADKEFSLLDRTLRDKQLALVTYLESAKVTIAGQEHIAYAWVRIHSGHGGGAEADHFKWATQGVVRAYQYTANGLHDAMRHQLHLGFVDFSRDHREFFERVGDSSPQ